MKRLVELAGALAGGAMAVLDLAVCLALLAGWLESWFFAGVFVPATAIQLLAFGLTFQPYSGPWRAAVRVTAGRVTVSRVALLLSAGLFTASVVLLLVRGTLDSRALELFTVALCLLMSTYVCVHWALRPERVFGVRFLRLMSPWSPTRLRGR